MTAETIAQIMVVTIVVTFVAVARWYHVRTPNWGDLSGDYALSRDADGAAIVPVTMLMHRRTVGATTNGISPRLSITRTGLRFTVFQPAELSFSDFKRVEAHKTLFQGTRLIFVGHGRWLHALIPDPRAARAVLRLLPPDLPLSPAAQALRGT